MRSEEKVKQSVSSDSGKWADKKYERLSRIKISENVLKKMIIHAEKEVPYEACGYYCSPSSCLDEGKNSLK